MNIKRINIGNRRASRRLQRACCRFGIGLTHGADLRAPTSTQSASLARIVSLEPGQIALITGPSGSGKSTLLTHLRAHLQTTPTPTPTPIFSRVVTVAPPSIYKWNASVIDLLPLGLDRALGLLSLVGLGDALLLGRTYSELSAGERARLDLARALSRATDAWLLADEFLTPLDRPTAAAIARAVRRALPAHFPRVCFVAATAHDDVTDWLQPDIRISLRASA